MFGGANFMQRSYLLTLGTAILLFTISSAEKANATQYQARSADDASMLDSQAAAAVDSHHYSEAVDLLERVVALRPDDARTRYRLGRALQDQKRFIDAIGPFRQALRLDPSFTEAHHALGLSYNNAGLYSEAIDA
jgi:Flp pilus assembly protein TadD